MSWRDQYGDNRATNPPAASVSQEKAGRGECIFSCSRPTRSCRKKNGWAHRINDSNINNNNREKEMFPLLSLPHRTLIRGSVKYGKKKKDQKNSLRRFFFSPPAQHCNNFLICQTATMMFSLSSADSGEHP